MKLSTPRFGEIEVKEDEIINFPDGIFGFNQLRKFCLVDPGDDTLILWLQSLEEFGLAFPVLEPKIFKPDYVVHLSGMEMQSLGLDVVSTGAVFSILTIPSDVNLMTANIKAPIVINLKQRSGKQVILQENEYSVKHSMFKELKTHLATIDSLNRSVKKAETQVESLPLAICPLELDPTSMVRGM